ncbi:MAG TPA: hypothetical protein VFK13_05335 [Gemmatimonadaceae bacterium]|nr:hypothetical protein [Gemmatimonadaceae bacterium]
MARKPVMTSSEFREARTQLGFTVEQAAGHFLASPELVRAWEKGSARVPRDAAAQVRWMVAAEEQQRVLAAPGVPACETMSELTHALETSTRDEFEAALAAVAAHAEGCGTCRARKEYLAHYGPSLPALYLPLWMRVLGHIGGLVNRLLGRSGPRQGTP